MSKVKNLKGSRGLTLTNLIAISSGQVIGAGVVTLIGPAIAETGISAWLAYAAAIAVGFLCILPFIFISSSLVLKGGEYSIVLNMLGERISGVYSVAFITQCLSLSLLGRSFGIYMNSIFPSVNIQIAGIIAVTIFYILNLRGVKAMSGVQDILSGILIIVLLAFVVFGFTKVDFSRAFDFSSTEFFTDGFGGFATAISLFAFSTYGQYMVINFSDKAENPKKDIPLAIMISTGIILVLYVGIAIVNTSVLPLSEVSGEPLTVVARAVFNPVFFAIFIIGGPIMALSTTMNSTYGSRANPLHRATEDGWFPKSFGTVNDKEVPSKIITFIYIVGLIPLILNLNISTITSNLVLVGNILRIFTAVSVFSLPEKYPQQWKNSWLNIPTGLFKIVMGLSLLGNLYLIYLSFTSLPLVISLINIAFIALCAVYAIYRYNTGKVNIVSSVSLD